MTTPVLQVRDLVKHFPVRSTGLRRRETGEVHAVCGVSFDLHAGQTLGIVGESGCGKSTTGRAVLGLQPATSGQVLFEGRDITHLRGKDLKAVRRDVQLVFQDPSGSLNPRMAVGASVAEPLVVHGIGASAAERTRMVADLFVQVGLGTGLTDRYPHELSGGQKQRVGIARALALRPKVLVLDEPVSALDVSVQASILNLLQSLQRDLGLAYAFIAHDLAVVRHLADQVLVMYLGRVVEQAPKAALFARPAHPYTQALLSAIPVPDPQVERQRRRTVLRGDVPSPVEPPSGCRFRTRCPLYRDALDSSARSLCDSAVPELTERGQGHPVACHHAELKA